MKCEGVMKLLREHVWRTVMESKQSQFWNAVAVAGFTVLAGILMGYGSTFYRLSWVECESRTA